MVYFVYGITGLVVIIAAILTIGALLPIKHTAHRIVVLEKPQAEVWAFMRNFEATPTWQKNITKTSMHLNKQGQEIWVEYSSEDDFLAFETIKDIAPHKLTRKIVGENLQFGGTWTFELSTKNNKTHLKITEHGEVYNIIFRFVAKFIIGHHTTMDQYITDLKRAIK